MQFYALIPPASVPTREAWEAAMAASGVELTFDPRFDPAAAEGFCPMHLGERETGCEIDRNVETFDDLLEMDPDLAPHAGQAVIAYSIGGDEAALACVLGSAAALVQAFDATFYDPQEGATLSGDELLEQFQSVRDGLAPE